MLLSPSLNHNTHLLYCGLSIGLLARKVVKHGAHVGAKLRDGSLGKGL